MLDVSETAALERRRALQRQLLDVGNRSFRPRTAKECFQVIRSYLIKASDKKLIGESPAQVRRLLEWSKELPSGVHDIAVGNVRNFHRSRELPHFSRPDGSWFDFQMIIRERSGAATIEAYGFELRMHDETPFPFVRFDFNPPGHDNDEHGQRSHIHLGTDDDGFSLPAPVMSPLEILDLFLFGLRAGSRRRV